MSKRILVNPRLLDVGHVKDKAHPFRMKCYYPFVGRVIRRKPYRTATEARERAMRVYERWCRLYQAAIHAMVEATAAQEPAG